MAESSGSCVAQPSSGVWISLPGTTMTDVCSARCLVTRLHEQRRHYASSLTGCSCNLLEIRSHSRCAHSRTRLRLRRWCFAANIRLSSQARVELRLLGGGISRAGSAEDLKVDLLDPSYHPPMAELRMRPPPALLA